ncbi:hypothetical protein MMF93_22860 [Streptomyces tubbatahanensis]|uniref:Uncharacterized protein n=1 Tax=Streptomyces tubbatahanensis TaxID=2923272 RepID=A0ABY3XX59_9ACTN|nr:hypothetical protein [Streptomyces tubbatahanensis]UNS98980.1 hypothetical protein MMF93_22860 [Streptomyces tubbatahanensis]
MLLSISAVLLLGLLIALLLRIRYLRWLEVLLCTTFGFLLAKSAVGPVFQLVLEGVGGFLGGLRF